MKPFLRWLLIGLGALVALGVAVIVAVVTLVDPARFRPAIVSAVQQSTGRTLTLDGDVGLKLLPCCAVEVTRLTLGNPPGFDAEPFVSIGSARLAIRLWPLLTRREVEIGTVRVTGLEANLVGRRDGSNNWTFTDATPEAPDAGGKGEAGGISSFNLAGISLDDARINYSDEADGTRYRVEQLQLATGAVRDGAPFEVSTSFRLTDLADNSGGAVKLSAQASVAVDGDITTVRLSTVDSQLDTRGFGGLEALRGTLRAPRIEVRLGDNTLLEAPELVTDLEAKGADLPGGGAPVQATLSGLRYDVDAGSGAVTRFTAKTTVAGVPLDLAGEGGFGERNDLRGTVRFPEFSPREVLAKLKQDVPVTADPDVLRKLSGAANWRLGDKSFGLEQLAVVLDDTRVAGSLACELLPAGSKATPRTQFDLTLDRLNADRYLEPDAPPSGKDGSTKDGDGKPTEIPVATIRGLNLQGRARIGQLTITGLKMADVDVTAVADGGRLRLEPLVAKAYGGSLRTGIRLDATGAKSRLTLDQALTGVNFGALLADLADVRNITGTISLNLAGTSVGATDDELLENLAGNLVFSLVDGTYKGMDVWYEIRRARALLSRLAPPARSGPEETPIKSLDLSGKLTDGVLRTDRFSAEIPFLRVAGDATVDLPKSRLDSKLTALVFEKPVFGDDTSLEDLVNVRIPLTISGPVASPRVGVDLSKMVKEALRDTARQTLEQKVLERLGLGKPAEEAAPPADGEEPAPPAPKADPLKDALDRLFKKGT
ncbi:MAG: AsmA family protein [Chromatiales bacterium]|nr:AsmA family protein [Chromatiales bacterium]